MAFLQSKPGAGVAQARPEASSTGSWRSARSPSGPIGCGFPLDRVDPRKPSPAQDGRPASWIAAGGDASGTFNLRGELGPKPGRAYLAVQVRSAREQSAVLRFGAEGAARVYLDGAKVAESPGIDPSSPRPAFASTRPGMPAPLPDLARLPLKAGWNLLIVALDRDGTGERPGLLRDRLARAGGDRAESPRN